MDFKARDMSSLLTSAASPTVVAAPRFAFAAVAPQTAIVQFGEDPQAARSVIAAAPPFLRQPALSIPAALPHALIAARPAHTFGAVVASRPAHSPGAFVKKHIQSAGEGSYMQKEAIAAAAEAARTLAWIVTLQDDWPAAFGTNSRIMSQDVLNDLLLTHMVTLGKGRVAGARRAVSRYIEFCIDHSNDIVGGPWPPSPEIVTWCLLDITEGARAKADKRGVEFKGTAAGGVAKGLAGAFAIFNAPFGPEIMDSLLVKMARTALSYPKIEVTAHWSVAAACHMEVIASSSTASPQLRDFARGLLITIFASLRCVEALRSRVIRYEPRSLKPFDDSHDGGFLELECAGGKPKLTAAMKPFPVWIPEAACIGDIAWFADFSADYAGKPFIFRSYLSSPANNVALASEWAPGCASDDQLRGGMASILALPPLSMSDEDRKSAGMTGHAPRSFLPDVTRAKLWPLARRGEIGRWMAVDGEEVGKSRKAQADSYSRNAAARVAQLKLRREALRIVSDYIGADDWQSVVPFQLGEQASFGFLVGGEGEMSESEDDE
jgi:hypothetical protein